MEGREKQTEVNDVRMFDLIRESLEGKYFIDRTGRVYQLKVRGTREDYGSIYFKQVYENGQEEDWGVSNKSLSDKLKTRD